MTSGAQQGSEKVKALPASGRRRLLHKTVVVAQSGTLAQPVEQPPVKRPVGSSSLPRPAQGVCKRHCRTEGWKGSNPLRPFCLLFLFIAGYYIFSFIFFGSRRERRKLPLPPFLFAFPPFFQQKKDPAFCGVFQMFFSTRSSAPRSTCQFRRAEI